MDKQTPTQIATQSMKGCGCRLQTFESKVILCGFEFPNPKNGRWFCPSCKSKILAHKMDWENELEFINRMFGNDCEVRRLLSNRISELTSALKILEGDKK